MNKYAVIKIKDKQFFVTEGTKIVTHPISKDDKVSVLLIKNDANLTIGEPAVTSGGVKIAHIQDKKVKTEVRRYRSKSRYRKNRSHGQLFSYLKVESIDPSLKTSEIVFEESKPKNTEKANKTTSTKEKKEVGLESLKLSSRAENALKEAKITLSKLKSMSLEEIESLEGIGSKTAKEIFEKLSSK